VSRGVAFAIGSRPSMKGLDAPDLVEKLRVLVHGIKECRCVCPTTKLGGPDRREQPSDYHKTQRRAQSAAAPGKPRGYLAFFVCVENSQCTPDSREVPWLYPFS